MGSIDQVDDRTFSVNFTGDGADKLRDRVNDKLKEFMGDYTDDTLVEYVIVLLKNGRRKEEAKNELNVFLGDDSDSFVSWLWDHLATNIGLYVQSEESSVDEVIKAIPSSAEKLGRSDSQKLDSESDRGKPNRESKIRHNKEWKGLVRDASDPPPLRSSEIENIHLDEKTKQRVRRTKRSPSPRPAGQRKRSRTVERQNSKREAVQVNTGATRRLLQFAVRDAVAMSKPSNTTAEPSLKRLRSVVSTPTGDSSLVDHPRRLKSVARVPNPMATVIKAVAEAAEDAVRVKSSGSVFDRLGRGMDVSRSHDQSVLHTDATVDDGEYGDDNQLHKQTRSTYLQRSDQGRQYVGNTTMLENDVGLASDSTFENEGSDDENIMRHNNTDVSRAGTSGGNKDEDSMMVDYSGAKNVDNLMQLKGNKEQDQPAVVSNTSQKIGNIYVNANTWKPPNYQEPRAVAGVDGWKSVQDGEGGASRSGMRIMRENSNHVAVNGNAKPAADSQKELLKTASPATGHVAGRPLEDADSRTLFVSNVHFAATKDSLSRHFNKFGDVLKVLIVTDATTGQPTGSAYVEFMRKEAADNALSLDGTSFMSRLLKVVKRSAAQQETATAMTWPRMTRGTPFATARFPRASFPRGLSSSFRGRPLSKPGARSFQWKRDAQPSSVESSTPVSGNPIPSPTVRSLTYVRTEPKPEAKVGTA